MTELVRPHVRYHRSFLDTARELEAEGNGAYLDLSRHPLGTLEVQAGFAAYVREVLARALPESPRPADHVPDGHATAALGLALAVAHDLGIDPALLTCDEDDTASRCVIERNGGQLEDVRGGKRRYWLATGGH